MHEKPEVELIAQSRCGDRSAMTELFGRYYPSSVRIAHRILRSHEDSLDAVQTAYLSAYKHFSSFRDDASFKTWITRIVINQCLVYFRKPERRLRWVWLDDVDPDGRPFALPGDMPSPEDIASSRETAERLAHAMRTLRPHMRQVVHLITVSGLSMTDAADALGISVPAAKTRLFRARAQMQAHLQGIRTGQRHESKLASQIQ